MTHQHNHNCSVCSHDCLHFCKCCSKVFCCKCGQEWGTHYNYYWTYPSTTITYPATNIWSAAGAISDTVTTTSCSHKH